MNHNRLIIIRLLAGLIVLSGGMPGALAAESYIIIDNQSGRILDGRDYDDKRQIASLTKVATAMVVLDWSEKTGQGLDQMAVVPPSALRLDGPNPIGLRAGDVLTLRDLLYASLLQSDNIAAHTLANHVGETLRAVTPRRVHELGPVGVFVAQMNALARSLGMERTVYLNPHGLDSGEDVPHSTAADQARMAQYAMRDSGFRFYVSQKTRTIAIRRPDGTLQFRLENTNSLVGTGGIDGIKTGTTRRAGACLMLSASKPPLTRQDGGRTLITPRRVTVVLLASPDRFAEGAALIQRGWALFDRALQSREPADPRKML